jgi:hypothetical protein
MTGNSLMGSAFEKNPISTLRTSTKFKVLLGMALLCMALILAPYEARAEEIDLLLPVDADAISSLNPPSSNFEVGYEAGLVQTADGQTILGEWMCVVPLNAVGNFNYFDCVMVLPEGNAYYKMVLDFNTDNFQGTILGGDGALQGISGTVEVSESGVLHRFTYSIP